MVGAGGTRVCVALDWTPNTNHAGFFIAKAQGLYAAKGLDVTFISPHTDEYKATPASRVETGQATFCITPSETVISHHTWPASQPKPKLQAVATLLQRDTSAIVTLKSSGIDRPAKLEGKRYASYSARFEGRIVQQMIKNDGGTGEYQELSLPMLGLWNTVLKGEADATWVFLAWEGVEARRQGIELNAFKLEDYNIQYGYSPVLLAHPDTLASQPDTVRSFLAATAEAYQWAAGHPAEAAELFHQTATAEFPDLPTPLDADMCRDSMCMLAEHLLSGEGRWGVQSAERWDAFLDWLSDSGLLTTKVQSRTPVDGVSTTLDGLRSGDAGDPIPRSSVQSSALFTNAFLHA